MGQGGSQADRRCHIHNSGCSGCEVLVLPAVLGAAQQEKGVPV